MFPHGDDQYQPLVLVRKADASAPLPRPPAQRDDARVHLPATPTATAPPADADADAGAASTIYPPMAAPVREAARNRVINAVELAHARAHRRELKALLEQARSNERRGRVRTILTEKLTQLQQLLEQQTADAAPADIIESLARDVARAQADIAAVQGAAAAVPPVWEVERDLAQVRQFIRDREVEAAQQDDRMESAQPGLQAALQRALAQGNEEQLRAMVALFEKSDVTLRSVQELLVIQQSQ